MFNLLCNFFRNLDGQPDSLWSHYLAIYASFQLNDSHDRGRDVPTMLQVIRMKETKTFFADLSTLVDLRDESDHEGLFCWCATERERHTHTTHNTHTHTTHTHTERHTLPPSMTPINLPTCQPFPLILIRLPSRCQSWLREEGPMLLLWMNRGRRDVAASCHQPVLLTFHTRLSPCQATSTANPPNRTTAKELVERDASSCGPLGVLLLSQWTF